MYVLKSGGRWADAPREVYGPKKTLYNRFVRWADEAVWVSLFETLAQAGGPPSQVVIPVGREAHRCASGGNVRAALSVNGFGSADLSSLHKRIWPSGEPLANVEISPSWAS